MASEATKAATSDEDELHEKAARIASRTHSMVCDLIGAMLAELPESVAVFQVQRVITGRTWKELR